MPIFDVLKRVIGRGNYNAADIQRKMNLYLLYDQMTDVEYDEIMALMNA